MRNRRAPLGISTLVFLVAGYLAFRLPGTAAEFISGLVCGFAFVMLVAFASGADWGDRPFVRRKKLSVTPK